MDEARPRRRHLCCSWHWVQLFALLEPWYGSVHSPAVHLLKAIGTGTGRAIYFIGFFFVGGAGHSTDCLCVAEVYVAY